MERLICSSPPISPPSSKTPLKSSPLFLPRLGATRLDSHTLRSSAPFRGINLFSSYNHEHPILSSKTQPLRCSYSSKVAPLSGSYSESATGVEKADGSKPRFPFLEQIAKAASDEQKAVRTGAIVLLSVLILTIVHPVIAPQAYATLHSATQSGGAAAAAVGGRLARTELLSSAWTGFFAGCLHTLSGPDHLAALAPLSIGRTRLESAAVGALWGCGHDAGQVIFGLLFLLLKDRLHIEIIRTWGTRVVGLTLLVIGAMGIKEASEVPAPCVALEDGECDVSVLESLETPTGGKKKKIGFATFATGIIHGLQPDALMMVLPALALPSRLAGAAFLVLNFGHVW